MASTNFLIEDIPFQNALIIDNRYEDIKSLEKYLQKLNVSVTYAKTSTEAEEIIKLRPEINLVILDWFLDEESELDAQQLLFFIKAHAFAPIIVYTDKGKEGPSYYLKTKKLDRVAMALDKSEVDGKTVFSEVKKWLDKNPDLKIFLMWDNKVKKNLNRTLWTIHDLESEGLMGLMEVLKTPEGFPRITRERDLIDFFGRALTRNLLVDEPFLKSIEEIVESMDPLVEDPNFSKLKSFHSFERYKAPGYEQICTGSILRTKANEFFIIVTPSCDFFHDGKVENIILIKAEPLGEYKAKRKLSRRKTGSCVQNKKSVTHYLPYVPNLDEGLVCQFDNISNINKSDLEEKIQKNEISCHAIIDSPFIENLIQRMNAYLMRLGVRDLHESEINKLLDAVIEKNDGQKES